jgi:uncharacterized protein (TIGR02145 family)
MAENLNYEVKDGVYYDYDNKSENCSKYGRLYDLKTAMRICPKGWHLPSKKEWQTLVDFAGGNEIAGKKLKAKSGWNNYRGKSGNGTDEFCFAALPGGVGHSNGNFVNVDNRGSWWSASEDYVNFASGWGMYYISERVYWYMYYKNYLFSVRCLQD